MTSNSLFPKDAIVRAVQAGIAELSPNAQHDLSGTVPGKLVAYLELLHRWNHAYNLTAIRDPLEMVTKHLLDSIVILPYIKGPSLADLGTGPGLPGIPIALARPDVNVVLVESNGKKCRFLRECVRTLALTNVRVCEQRAEAGDPTGARHAQVTARALTALPDLLALAAPWLDAKGEMLAMKGPGVEGEIAGLDGSAWHVRANHRLIVPGLSGERFLLQVQRAA